MDLQNRVVLITGAARRLGRAIALRLARRGCRIAAHYHRSEADVRTLLSECAEIGVDAEAFRANLAEIEATRALVPAVLKRFGALDVLVNNASRFERMDLDTFAPHAWEETLRVNLAAPMILAHAARDALRAARGRIVNLHDAATARPWPDHLAYIVSKGALDTLTRALARAFAPEVNVVGVAPGVADWPAEYDDATRARLTARIPLGRPGSPEDVAAAVQFLLAEGDYITGVVLPVDGGRQIR
ncbi:MAG: SDR family oxidoreductase [Phycisphaerae bacterium]